MYNRLMMIFIVSLIFVSCSGENQSQPGKIRGSGGKQSAGAENSQNTAETQKHWILFVPFQKIEKGSFKMGKAPFERGANLDEGARPEGFDSSSRARVKISRPFEIMTTEVTQSQWLRVMGNNPSRFKEAKHCDDHKEGICPNNPVEQVSWTDVQEFIKKLNEALKLSDCDGTPSSKKGCYRLPTEAEWEYAARGGTKTAFSFGAGVSNLGDYPWSHLEDYAWYTANSENRTHKVGLKRPNPNGLYDVHGNVWEWVQDGYTFYLPGGTDPLNNFDSPRGRVGRGGAWNNLARHLRSACRGKAPPADGFDNTGFRLVRTL